MGNESAGAFGAEMDAWRPSAERLEQVADRPAQQSLRRQVEMPAEDSDHDNCDEDRIEQVEQHDQQASPRRAVSSANPIVVIGILRPSHDIDRIGDCSSN